MAEGKQIKGWQLLKVALRNRESLAVLRPREGALLVQTMLWPDELRDAGTFAPGEDVDVRDQEVAMAESYIDTLTEDFDPTQFSDNYRQALEELVEAKAGGRRIEATDEPVEQGTVVDLMAALRASVEAAKQRREGDGSTAAKPAKKTAAAKAPAKKAADKPAAKKTAEKKPAKTAKTAAKTATKASATKKAASASRTRKSA